MGQISTAQGVWSPVVGAPTEQLWGANVAEHVVQRFSTIATRNTNWTTPPNGAVCTVNTGYTMWQRRGSTWTQIGPALLTNPVTATGAAAPVTTLQHVHSAVQFHGKVSLPAYDPAPGNVYPQYSTHATPKGYVDHQDSLLVRKTGGTITGSLTADRFYTRNPPGNQDGLTNKTYVDAHDKLRVSKAGDTMTGGLHIHVASAAAPNIVCWRGINADKVGEDFIRFTDTKNDIIGRIEIVSANTVGYKTSSDHRLKVFVGPVTNATERIAALARRAFRGTWRDGTEQEWDMLNAHDIAEVAPYAVSGEKDGDGYQMVDYGSMVPMLTAALGAALERIDKLEARLA